MATVTLEHADMRQALAAMAANGVRFDSCVTDPPYHLASIVKRFGGKTAAPAKSGGATGVYARASKGFMGKEWDGGDIAFRPETWALVGSVLKPGAHLVAFGAPKNAHRLTCAIEDAGFEIRDDIVELLSSDALVQTFVDSLSEAQADAFARILEESPLGGALGRLFWMFGTGFPKSHDVAKGIDKRRELSETAKAWQGWGTALKPAYEPIILARWPLDGTVAENVLEHGTGALNIDGCRVSMPDRIVATRNVALGSSGSGVYGRADKPGVYEQNEGGRWPANVVTDGSDEVRLVTPQGGAVLDPFAGSGTTGMAALAEGFDATLVEREAEYAADIRRRIAHVSGADTPLFAAAD